MPEADVSLMKDATETPKISVVICTRNRGNSTIQGLETVFENKYPNFEVILVDQSTNEDTKNAVIPFQHYPNFKYLHSETIGIGHSRNIGLFAADSEIVAYTDDDCTVPSNWIEVTAKIFKENPKVALVYFNVEAGPHDPSKGYIPDYVIKKNRMLRTLRDAFPGLGLGAAMALRREPYIQMGGFDNYLGAGSRFRAGEDRDIAIRALIKKWWVYDANDVSVVHYGFRSWQEGIAHSQRDWFSLGATYVKAVKCGYWRALIVFFSAPILLGLFEPIINIFRLKKPRGFRRWIYYFHGAYVGIKTPADCKNILYLSD